MYESIDTQKASYTETYDVLFGRAEKCFACHNTSITIISVDGDILAACEKHLNHAEWQTVDADVDLV